MLSTFSTWCSPKPPTKKVQRLPSQMKLCGMKPLESPSLTPFSTSILLGLENSTLDPIQITPPLSWSTFTLFWPRYLPKLCSSTCWLPSWVKLSRGSRKLRNARHSWSEHICTLISCGASVSAKILLVSGTCTWWSLTTRMRKIRAMLSKQPSPRSQSLWRITIRRTT